MAGSDFLMRNAKGSVMPIMYAISRSPYYRYMLAMPTKRLITNMSARERTVAKEAAATNEG